jgi:hypothetical protein
VLYHTHVSGTPGGLTSASLVLKLYDLVRSPPVNVTLVGTILNVPKSWSCFGGDAGKAGPSRVVNREITIPEMLGGSRDPDAGGKGPALNPASAAPPEGISPAVNLIVMCDDDFLRGSLTLHIR